MRFLAVAAVGLTAVVSQSISAKDPLVLEPSSPWVLDYDADSCALSRVFGEGEQQTQLEMRRFQPTASLQTTIASRAKMSRRSIRYRFGDEGEWKDEYYPLYAYFDDGFEGAILLHALFKLPLRERAKLEEWSQFHIDNDVPAMEAEAAAGLDSLTVLRAFQDDLILRTGSLERPVRALNECVDELLTHWGIDVEAHKALTRGALPRNLPRAGRIIDYPPKMAEQRLPGFVNIRLDIDAAGQVSACHIQMRLSDPDFERNSCAGIKRALKFEPALDRDGRPIPSYWVTSVRFLPPP